MCGAGCSEGLIAAPIRGQEDRDNRGDLDVIGFVEAGVDGKGQAGQHKL